MVEDIQKKTEELLLLYFDNEGGDVENVMLNEVEQSVLITFKDHKSNAVTVHVKYYYISIRVVLKKLEIALC